MNLSSSVRLTAVWAVLSVVSVVSWSFGRTADGDGQVVASAATTTAVLAMGLVKARLVLRTFMEVRTAPRWLRAATDAWLVGFWGTVLALYLL